MKIAGLALQPNSEQLPLLRYALDLFDQVEIQTKIVDMEASMLDFRLVLVLTNDVRDREKILTIAKNTPVFVLYCNETLDMEKLDHLLENDNIWNAFWLTNWKDEFDHQAGIIGSVPKRLELIKKINHTMFSLLGIKNYDYFSCGIERQDFEVGDEGEH